MGRVLWPLNKWLGIQSGTKGGVNWHFQALSRTAVHYITTLAKNTNYVSAFNTSPWVSSYFCCTDPLDVMFQRRTLWVVITVAYIAIIPMASERKEQLSQLHMVMDAGHCVAASLPQAHWTLFGSTVRGGDVKLPVASVASGHDCVWQPLVNHRCHGIIPLHWHAESFYILTVRTLLWGVLLSWTSEIDMLSDITRWWLTTGLITVRLCVDHCV